MASALMLVGIVWTFIGLFLGLMNVFDPDFLAAARRGYETFSPPAASDAQLRFYCLVLYVVAAPVFLAFEVLSVVGKLRRIFSS